MKARGLAGAVGMFAIVLLGACSSGASVAVRCRSGAGGCDSGEVLPGSCQQGLSRASEPPRALAGSLESDVLSSFAILRRSALPSDEPPVGALSRELGQKYEVAGYYPAYIRRLSVSSDGRSYFLVPGYANPRKVPPAKCLGGHVNRVALVEQQRRRLSEPVYCLLEIPDRDMRDLGCEPFAGVSESNQLFRASDFLREPVIDIVPDGVARIRITYLGADALMVPVRANAFTFMPPLAPRRIRSLLDRLSRRLLRAQGALTKQWNEDLKRTDPMKVEWLDSSGRVIRAMTPPTAATVLPTSIGDIRAPVGG
jgi:hypothetical protein